MRAQIATTVVVACVLSLSSTACVRKYLAASKAAEARNALGQIGKSAAAAYDREKLATGIIAPGKVPAVVHELCASATTSVPASPAAIRGKKYQSAPADWSVDAPDGGFACLRFTMDQPQYYLYAYTRSGKGSTVGDGFSAKANGDINGDGVLSTFELKGQIGPGDVLNVAPNILEMSPEE